MKFPFRRLRAVLALSLGAAVLPAVAGAATAGFELRITPDRADATYPLGATVTFTVRLFRHGSPVDGPDARWHITKDGMPLGLEGVASLGRDGITLTARLPEPGFLQCRVECSPPGAPQLTARGAAAIAPDEIQPSLPPPADFDAFWRTQQRLLAATPARLRLTPVASPVEGIDCFDVQSDTGAGRPLSGYLARPAGARPRSLPAIVLTHAAGVVPARLTNAVKWASDGFAALDFNAHGLPNDRPRDYYTALQDGELRDYYLQGRDSRETMYLRGIVLRLLRAVEAVALQPEWDGRRLVVLGRSQGGGLAIVAGGLDSRVTFVAAELPALCDLTGFAAERISGWPRLGPGVSSTSESGFRAAARYYDAVNFAARIRGQVFFTVGYIDTTCPPTGVHAAFNQVRGRKEVWRLLDTGHVSRVEHEERVRDAVLAHVRSAPPR